MFNLAKYWFSACSSQFSQSQITKYTVQPEPDYQVYRLAREKSPSIQFSQNQVTQYTVQPEPTHPVYSSARAQVTKYTVQPEPSHPVYSLARAESPSIQFSQSQVT